ncbi:hypothetical protein QZH41_017164 [Actinostola sp. cb2023]|nr:hypothetical protein QZH41_017164 [Actinostola sp. cb2023]
MAEVGLVDERSGDIRETDLNGDVIPGAIGTSATSSITFDDDDSGKFPQMEEMLKVATDLQGGANVDDNRATGQSPRLEFEETGFTEMCQTFCSCEAVRHSKYGSHRLAITTLQVKVMHKQLLLFNNAITAYFSGNKQALESCVKEFHIKMKAKESEHSSFLEH